MNNYCKKGFTLVEILIVIAIFGIVGSAASVMFNGTRNRVSLEDAQASVINALERARSRAATGVGTEDHGVCIDGNKLIAFEGNSCPSPTTDNSTDLAPNISVTNSPAVPVIFNRLSATSSADTTFTIENTITGSTTIVIVTKDGIIEK